MKVVQDNMKKIWVNGTFDVLHIGHIKLVEFASMYGIVRVGIDSDIRVKQLKGELRPINTISDRLEFMSSIKYVDSVVSFSSDKELCQKIKEWSTDIIIVGSDYRHKPVIGSELVGEVIIFDKLRGFSTTNIIGNKL